MSQCDYHQYINTKQALHHHLRVCGCERNMNLSRLNTVKEKCETLKQVLLVPSMSRCRENPE